VTGRRSHRLGLPPAKLTFDDLDLRRRPSTTSGAAFQTSVAVLPFEDFRRRASPCGMPNTTEVALRQFPEYLVLVLPRTAKQDLAKSFGGNTTSYLYSQFRAA
jgi:hypothetical protein